MKKLLPLAGMAMLLAASCASNSEKTGTVDVVEINENIEVAKPARLTGQWTIRSIHNGANTVDPATTNPGEDIYVEFTDTTIYCQTGCNGMSGNYRVKGDSIFFDYLMSTRMACPNMEVEDALGMVIPQVKTYSVENDSVLRLSSEKADTYVSLVRNTAE